MGKVRWIAVAVIVLLVIPGAIGLGLGVTHPAATAQSASDIPDGVQQQTVETLDARYGGPTTVVLGEASTLGKWHAIEPAATDSLAVDASDANDPVYGFLVRGTFTISEAPPSPTGQDTGAAPVYHQGRVVVDDTGRILNVWFWPDGRLDVSALDSSFGTQFDPQ